MLVSTLEEKIKVLRVEEIQIRQRRWELECELTARTTDPRWTVGDIKIWRAIDRRETKHIKILESIPERDGWKYKVQYELSNGAEISPTTLAREEDLYPTKDPNKYYAKKKPRIKLKATTRKEKTSQSSQEILDLLNSI